jgi:hypothetical protein
MPTITFSEAAAPVSAWMSLVPIRLGAGELERHLLVERDGVPAWRFELRKSHRAETWFHSEAIYWNEQIVVGFAERVCCVRLVGTGIACIELNEYFSGFYPGGDWLLVVSGADITRLDAHGNTVWRSERLALDGVVIRAVRNDIITGDGEWDPPGGWRPFAISLTDGTSAPPAST